MLIFLSNLHLPPRPPPAHFMKTIFQNSIDPRPLPGNLICRLHFEKSYHKAVTPLQWILIFHRHAPPWISFLLRFEKIIFHRSANIPRISFFFLVSLWKICHRTASPPANFIFRFTLKNEIHGGSRVYQKCFSKWSKKWNPQGIRGFVKTYFCKVNKKKWNPGVSQICDSFFKVKRRSHKKIKIKLFSEKMMEQIENWNKW